jgi:hypothetical protein
LIRRLRHGGAAHGWEETSKKLQNLICPPRTPTAEELSKLACLRQEQMEQYFNETLKMNINIPAPPASGRQIRRRQREGWELFCRPIDHDIFMKALAKRFNWFEFGSEMQEPFHKLIIWDSLAEPYWFWYRTSDFHRDAAFEQLCEMNGRMRLPKLEEYLIAFHHQKLKGLELKLAGTYLLTFAHDLQGRGFRQLDAMGDKISQCPQLLSKEKIAELTQ